MIHSIIARILLGVALSLCVAVVGYRVRSLSGSGVVAAVVVGSAVFGGGAWEWGSLLVAFFVGSSALSHIMPPRKRDASRHFQKRGRRDAGQVLANGGVAALAGMGQMAAPQWTSLWFGLLLGSLAAANADTWATEIGLFSRSAPRHVLTGRSVPPGTSGGVSVLGSAATLAGAAAMGLVAWAAGTIFPSVLFSTHSTDLLYAAVGGGVIGCWVDSLAGACWQGQYSCPRCRLIVESPVHCDTAAALISGRRWVTNDVVNVLGVLSGGLVGGTLLRLAA